MRELTFTWEAAIERNRKALAQIIAILFAMAGLAGGKAQTISLGVQTQRAIQRILRPAESALRRLIVIVAYARKPKLPAPRDTLPDFSDMHANTSGHALERIPTFRLYDPRKKFRFNDEMNGFLAGQPRPRISVPGLFEPGRKQIAIASAPCTKKLLRRLLALDHALNTLPRQARRLVLNEYRRSQRPAGPRKVPPLRPGAPPGRRKRCKHVVDELLQECHILAMDILHAPP